MNGAISITLEVATVVGLLLALGKWLVRGIERDIPILKAEINRLSSKIDEHSRTTEQEENAVIKLSQAMAVMGEAMNTIKDAIREMRADLQRASDRQERHEQWHFQQKRQDR